MLFSIFSMLWSVFLTLLRLLFTVGGLMLLLAIGIAAVIAVIIYIIRRIGI